jgi:hypothetical protein
MDAGSARAPTPPPYRTRASSPITPGGGPVLEPGGGGAGTGKARQLRRRSWPAASHSPQGPGRRDRTAFHSLVQRVRVPSVAVAPSRCTAGRATRLPYHLSARTVGVTVTTTVRVPIQCTVAMRQGARWRSSSTIPSAGVTTPCSSRSTTPTAFRCVRACGSEIESMAPGPTGRPPNRQTRARQIHAQARRERIPRLPSRAVSGNLRPMSEIQNVASIFFKKNHMFNNIFHN